MREAGRAKSERTSVEIKTHHELPLDGSTKRRDGRGREARRDAGLSLLLLLLFFVAGSLV